MTALGSLTTVLGMAPGLRSFESGGEAAPLLHKVQDSIAATPNMLPALVGLLGSSNATIQRDAAGTLLLLAYGNPNSMTAITNNLMTPGSIANLVSTFGAASAGSNHPQALVVILAVHNTAFRNYLASAPGCMDKLLFMASSADTMMSRAMAAEVLGILTGRLTREPRISDFLWHLLVSLGRRTQWGLGIVSTAAAVFIGRRCHQW